jgi:hypothetical protein
MEEKRLEIHISRDGYEKLETMATKATLTPELLASVLIQAFIDNDGKVFTGEWDEGPGLRLLADWPRFSSGVVKIKKETKK